MTDIVERLRDLATAAMHPHRRETIREAADEIERLRRSDNPARIERLADLNDRLINENAQLKAALSAFTSGDTLPEKTRQAIRAGSKLQPHGTSE